MTHPPPDAIGPYIISRELGRGGMGVVYLATDTRLDRDVAIKALPVELASDPARLERFEREAKTLAQLSHPNIAGIHGIEEHEGARYLVLEYVEGQTLADLLDRGPLPVEDAIEYAVQIAAGVEAAHEAGVIHRDLKPGNIIITPEGQAKVLDFGLARTEEAQGSSTNTEAATITSPAIQHSPTMPGVILGTAAYMSPEQARGHRVDKRTDIWSFGVLLYEMLTGVGPFRGETVTDSIGAILHKDVDLDQLPPGTPANVRRVLRRCLTRDKAQRYRDIGDARIELQSTDEETSPAHPATSSRVPWFVAALAIVLAAIVIAGSGLLGSEAPAPGRPVVKFAFETPVTGAAEPTRSAQGVILTPDGSAVTYNHAGSWDGSDTIWIRRMDQLTPRSLRLPWEAYPVCWAPDGHSIIVRKGSFTGGELWRVGIDGGAPRLIGALPKKGFLWKQSVIPLDDETLLISMARDGIYTMPVRGGDPQPLLRTRGDELLVCATPIPGTDTILFADVGVGRIERLTNGRREVVLDLEGDRIEDFKYSPTGHILFSIWTGERKRGVWAAAFSPTRLEVVGDPFWLRPYGDVSCSASGALAYCERPASRPEPRRLVWVNRNGEIDGVIGDRLLRARTPSLSPDGRRVAVAYTSDTVSEDVSLDILIIDTVSGARYELSDDLGSDHMPEWRDGGETVVYTTWNAGIRQVRERSADGLDEPRLVTDQAYAVRVSADERFTVVQGEGLGFIKQGSTERTPFDPGPIDDFDISSDSRFVAYTPADAPGVRIRPFPEGAGLTAVTSLDAEGVRFNHDDTELCFWNEGALMSAAIDLSGARPVVSPPRRLFEAAPNNLRTGGDYDIASDGRFLMIQELEPDLTSPVLREVIVIQNWAAEYEPRD